jgi:polyhydroxybutyrate depolymerase
MAGAAGKGGRVGGGEARLARSEFQCLIGNPLEDPMPKQAEPPLKAATNELRIRDQDHREVERRRWPVGPVARDAEATTPGVVVGRINWYEPFPGGHLAGRAVHLKMSEQHIAPATMTIRIPSTTNAVPRVQFSCATRRVRRGGRLAPAGPMRYAWRDNLGGPVHGKVIARAAVLLLTSLLALLLPACRVGVRSGESTPAASLGPGDHRVDIEFGGRSRSYILHLPPAAGAGRPLPVVVNFHGAMTDGALQQLYSHMDPLADRAGFAVIYPDGTGRGRFLFWNAGACCASAVLQQVNDVGFTLALLDDCARRAPIDLQRVYATGMSNGAMMAHRLAAEVPRRIAAIAPVAGGLVFPRFAPGPPVPVLHIHSVDDPRALYRGGLGFPGPGTRSRFLHPDVDAMMRRWAEHDGCPPEPRMADSRRAENGHTATLFLWAPCRDGAEVGLWRLTGAGHVWPGATAHMPIILGADTRVLDANQVIWDFVSRFRRQVRS